MIACIRICATFIPVDMTNPLKLAQIIRDCQPHAAICVAVVLFPLPPLRLMTAMIGILSAPVFELSSFYQIFAKVQKISNWPVNGAVFFY
jgi:hypothetical protein